ncbi:MAG: Bug family tripartite tricarboxylate transporter substrate binding protein [Lautropia sp.]
MKILRLVALLIAFLGASAASALEPGKPIRIVVPYGPGGLVDVMSRILASQMTQALSQPVVVENRAGANANLGPVLVVHEAPDGHTLLASASYFTINPRIEKNLQWRPDALAPVARFASSPSLMVVPGNAPYSDMNGFIAAARIKPGMPFGDGGVGAPQTMSKAMLERAANVQFLSVYYKGGVSYLPDLVSGTLQMAILPVNLVLGMVRSGQLKALAITGAKRSPLLPEIPTMAESGFPQATMESWVGLHLPAGTPRDVVDRLAVAVKFAAANSEVQAQLEKLGATSAFLDTAAFTDFVRDDGMRVEGYVKLVEAK